MESKTRSDLNPIGASIGIHAQLGLFTISTGISRTFTFAVTDADIDDRWVCIRIETLAGLFASALAAYLVYWGGVNASNTGFSLTMAGKWHIEVGRT